MSDFENPYASPQFDPAAKPPSVQFDTAGLWRDGRLLVMRSTSAMSGIPNRCMKCNTDAVCEKFKQKMGFYKVPFVLCTRHRLLMKRGKLIGGLAIMWLMLGPLAAGLVFTGLDLVGLDAAQNRRIAGAVVLLLWVVFIWFGLKYGRMLRIKRHHRNRIWIAGASLDYLNSLPTIPKDLI